MLSGYVEAADCAAGGMNLQRFRSCNLGFGHDKSMDICVLCVWCVVMVAASATSWSLLHRNPTEKERERDCVCVCVCVCVYV